jgi:imidazolonepropionase
MISRVTIRASHQPPWNPAARWDRIWVGAHLATMTDGETPYGEFLDGAIAVADGRIAWIGAAAEGVREAAARGLSAQALHGAWVTPGLIDCHTHLVYGGNRVGEYERRLNGATYEEISRAGGGIAATVRATRAASSETLHAAARGRALRLMAEGVTTIEVKSGYGMELDTERRLLQVARALGRELPVSIVTTYLGLHALPDEFKSDRRGFVDRASGAWLEALADEGLVDAVDGFCENIAFTLAETEQLLRAAQSRGLGIHLHAGQLSDMGAAELAAKYAATSADHLEFVSESGAAALAASATVAVLLPGAFYTLRQTRVPPAAMLRAAGVRIAVATDCNPGTSPCTSVLLAMNMACTLFGLTPAQALRGVTVEAAHALGLAHDRGTLEVGKRADFAIWDIDRPAELCYGLGANPCVGVVRSGRRG